jgi:hypothetical protein
MRKFLLLVTFLLLVQPVQAADVGVNATAAAGCGDGSCNYAETCTNCPQDCSCPAATGSGSGVIGIGRNTTPNATGTTGAAPPSERAAPSQPAEQPTGASAPQGETTSTVPAVRGQQPGIPLGTEAIVIVGLLALAAFIAFRHTIGKKVVKHHLARNRW